MIGDFYRESSMWGGVKKKGERARKKVKCAFPKKVDAEPGT
jgi:hypothetical protein